VTEQPLLHQKGPFQAMEIQDEHATRRALQTRVLLLCGATGPLLFVAAFFIEGTIRPNYNQWQTTISTLSLGDQGWVQIASFCLFGLSTLCIAIALKRMMRDGPGSRWGPVLLIIIGVGLTIAGPFVTDPILGYPPTSPSNGPPSLHGTIHNIASLIVFVALPAVCFVLGRHFARDSARGLAVYSIASGILIIFLVVWFFAAVGAATRHPDSGGVPPGLLERLFSIVGCCWLSLTAFRLLRQERWEGK
jgi:hypothetical protein